jgi:hypothetical protein
MRITMRSDCTPDEARRLLGLPDFRPVQDALAVEVQRRARGAAETTAPSPLLRAWLPFASRSFEQAQRATVEFWAASFGSRRSGGPDGPGKADEP